VFIIDRGANSPASNQYADGGRIWKVVFLSVDANSYTLKYSRLDGSDTKTVTLYKNPAYNYIYFSFVNGEINPEPPKKQLGFSFYPLQAYFPKSNHSLPG